MNATTATLNVTYTTYDAEDMRNAETVYVGATWAGVELQEGCVRRAYHVSAPVVDFGAWFWAGGNGPTFIHFDVLARAATVYRLQKAAAEATRQAVAALS